MAVRTSSGNFLAIQGRLLAEGKQAQLTPEEWLYVYGQISDDLSGAQVKILDGFEQSIRNRVVDRAMVSVSE